MEGGAPARRELEHVAGVDLNDDRDEAPEYELGGRHIEQVFLPAADDPWHAAGYAAEAGVPAVGGLSRRP